MSRRLTAGEIALAQSVFAEAVDLASVRIHGGGFGRFAVTVGSRLFVPRPMACADYAAGPPSLCAFLIHELTHVWQFQTQPLRTLASWMRVAARGGYGPGLPGYAYTLPLPPWEHLNLEQQASVVEHAYLIRHGHRPGGSLPLTAQRRELRGKTPFPLLDADDAEHLLNRADCE